jgi:hypothetical protein
MRLLAVLAWIGLAAPVAAAPISAQQRREVVEDVAAKFAERYVFEDRAARIAAHLRKRSKQGAFDAAADTDALAAKLTEEIRAVDADKHIEVVAPAAPAAPSAAPAPADRFGWMERLARRNYDFARVERLPGNVGYLDLRSFPPPEVAGETARAAMRMLYRADVVIIDLRKNSGGTGEMAQMLASYFFVNRTALVKTFRRADNPQVTVDYTLTHLEGERMPAAELFILTSPETFSAAEAFAFGLQKRGRATVVGARTKGGANAGRYVTIVHGFRAFVPNAHASDAYSDESWEGAGIKPDIETPEAQALERAWREALTRLIARASGPEDKAALEKLLAGPPPAS